MRMERGGARLSLRIYQGSHGVGGRCGGDYDGSQGERRRVGVVYGRNDAGNRYYAHRYV